MPEFKIAVGTRMMTIGFEPHEMEEVTAAAEILGSEVKAIDGPADRGQEVPPSQLLLLAGLRIAGKLRELRAELSRTEESLSTAGQSDAASERELLDGLSSVADLAEQLSDRIEGRSTEQLK